MIRARTLAVDLAGAHGRALAQMHCSRRRAETIWASRLPSTSTAPSGRALQVTVGTVAGVAEKRARAAAEELHDALSRAVGAPATITVVGRPPEPMSTSMPEPPRRAAALRDGDGDASPEVVASGRGETAQRIAEAARAAGVPVREDAALAEALARLDVGRVVPEELHVAMAEALVWAYRLDAAASRGRGGG
jgi:flagellar biosynthesis protein